jgi:uncharacterized protein (TIGR03083 family)
MNKAELLERTRSERAALDEVTAKLTEDELTSPVLEDGWSIKDVVAHLAVWERRIVREIGHYHRGERLTWPEPGHTLADVDKLNAQDLAASKERGLEDVLAESRQTYAGVIGMIEAMSDDELSRPTPWSGSRLLIELVRGNADEHYREHLDLIEAWWAGA